MPFLIKASDLDLARQPVRDRNAISFRSDPATCEHFTAGYVAGWNAAIRHLTFLAQEVHPVLVQTRVVISPSPAEAIDAEAEAIDAEDSKC